MDLSNLPLIWRDHPANPLIRPPWPEFLIADPTFLRPEDAPDGQWHLFAHGILLGIHHFVSPDGIRWKKTGGRVAAGMRPFVFRESGYHLFFEKFITPWRSIICRVQSDDLRRWSRPEVVLEPSLSWEGEGWPQQTNGNPCVLKRDGEYLLYYSAGSVFLRDCGFTEPRHIGVARSANLFGPYRKQRTPMLSPSPAAPHRNLGAGAIKVILDEVSGKFLGFNNGIHRDAQGRSSSDIRLLVSDDGVRWKEAADAPLVYPEAGWKRALVYALDVRPVGGELWMYYNARDGWFRGKERIGLAVCARPEVVSREMGKVKNKQK